MTEQVQKPVRKYAQNEYNRIVIGQGAIVACPENEKYSYFTTEVLSHDSNTGEFETKNTRYVLA